MMNNTTDIFPVTIAVRRPDGSIENIPIGTAVREGDAFRLRLGDLAIGGTPLRSAPQPAFASPMPASAGATGMVFPNYGRSKGKPIAGATLGDLEFYANGCRRTLSDPAKARWHDKEKVLLAAIEAEIARQRGGPASPTAPAPAAGFPASPHDDVPPPDRNFGPPVDDEDDDIPF